MPCRRTRTRADGFSRGRPFSDRPECRLTAARAAALHSCAFEAQPVAAHHARSVPLRARSGLISSAAPIAGAVQSRARRALVSATVDSRSLLDGRHVRVPDRDTSTLLSGSGSLQHRLVCRARLGLLSSSIVLVVLLYEITALYGGLLAAVLRQRREREARLMTGDAVAASIAHEVKQPLTAMITSADAGFRFLDRSTPNLDRAKEAFRLIATDGHRAGEVVENIRANFKTDLRTRISLDINELIQEALVSGTRRSGEAPDTGPSRNGCAAAGGARKSSPAAAGAPQLDHQRHRRDGGQG